METGLILTWTAIILILITATKGQTTYLTLSILAFIIGTTLYSIQIGVIEIKKETKKETKKPGEKKW